MHWQFDTIKRKFWKLNLNKVYTLYHSIYYRFNYSTNWIDRDRVFYALVCRASAKKNFFWKITWKKLSPAGNWTQVFHILRPFIWQWERLFIPNEHILKLEQSTAIAGGHTTTVLPRMQSNCLCIEWQLVGLLRRLVEMKTLFLFQQ